MINYVNIIKRIVVLDNALNRTAERDYFYLMNYDEETSFEIARDKVYDKQIALIDSLKQYINERDSNHKKYPSRRKQVKLACKLLDLDYNNLLHGKIWRLSEHNISIYDAK